MAVLVSDFADNLRTKLEAVSDFTDNLRQKLEAATVEAWQSWPDSDNLSSTPVGERFRQCALVRSDLNQLSREVDRALCLWLALPDPGPAPEVGP